MRVGIWFYHCKGSLSILLEFSPCGYVSVITDFELAPINSEDGPNVEFVKVDSCIGAPFQKDSLVLNVELKIGLGRAERIPIQ